MPDKPFKIRSASDDDPIYKEGWTVYTPQGFREPSKTPGANTTEASPSTVNHATGTGMDYIDQWPDELRVIFEFGPLTTDEMKNFDQQQITDYFYTTSWTLRQYGEAVFKAERETMRAFFLDRLESGKRLRPDVP